MSDPERAKELYDRGRDLEKSGDWEAALSAFRTQRPSLLKTFELAGNCLLEMGRHGEAIVYLAAAATLGRKQSRCRFLLANALSSLGEVEEAITFLDECLELTPGYRVAVALRNELLASS